MPKARLKSMPKKSMPNKSMPKVNKNQFCIEKRKKVPTNNFCWKCNTVNSCRFMKIQQKPLTVVQLKQEMRNKRLEPYVFPIWMMRKDGLMNLQSNRPGLVQALENYHQRWAYLVRIQSVARGYLARCYYAFKRFRQRCTNDSDFCSMDPLQEISIGLLFIQESTSSSSSASSSYGFNMASLLTYFYKSRSTILYNPYNREVISLSTIARWLHLTRLFDPLTFATLQTEPYYKYFLSRKGEKRLPTISLSVPVFPLMVASLTEGNPEFPVHYNRDIAFEEEHIALYQHLTHIHQMPLDVRIQELFMDFDLCGNYTQAEWFLPLNLRLLKLFYVRLRDLWYNLPLTVRQSICVIGDPFYLVHIQSGNISLQEIKMACVRVMEYITYGCHNKEDQKLGVFQILIALTSVSYNAHTSMPHLGGN